MIKFVMLMNGQGVIASVEEQEDKYLLDTPMSLINTGDGLAMVDSFPLTNSSKPFEVPRSSVVVIADVDEKYLKAYEEVTNPSEIITPPEKQLIV